MNQVEMPVKRQDMNSWPMVRTMGGVGILCAILIVFTYQTTLPTINHNKAVRLESAIYEVLPGAVNKKTFAQNATGEFVLLADGTDAAGRQLFYAGYDESGELAGIAMQARGQGFQDVITFLFGYSPEKQAVVGIKVLESKETPGLGDKIEKDPAFLQNFVALDVSLADDHTRLANPVTAVKKGEKTADWQIECITGATISSKAISTILNEKTSRVIPDLVEHLENFK